MNHLLREVTTPHSRVLKVGIPEDFVGLALISKTASLHDDELPFR